MAKDNRFDRVADRVLEKSTALDKRHEKQRAEPQFGFQEMTSGEYSKKWWKQDSSGEEFRRRELSNRKLPEIRKILRIGEG